MQNGLVLALQPGFKVVRNEDAGKKMKSHRRQRKDNEGNDQFGFKVDAKNMLFPFINQLQQIACNQVKDDCQEDNVDVDGNEEDQP